MWRFLESIASTYGFGALIGIIALGGMGYAIRGLWKRNQELSNGAAGKQLKAIEEQLRLLLKLETELHEVHLGVGSRDDQNRIKWYGAARIDGLIDRVDEILHDVCLVHAEKINSLRNDHDAQVAELRNEFAERLTALQTIRQNETAAYSRRIDELHEKRLAETKEIVTVVVRSSTETNAAVQKISGTMDTLTDVMTRGR